MNFVKNLMIIAVLAAVGYGVYVSLSRNNVDPGPSPGVADTWTTGPRVELPQAKSSAPGGPLPLSSPSLSPSPSGLASAAPVAPSLSIPSPAIPSSSPPSSSAGPQANVSPATGASSVTPYPSSNPVSSTSPSSVLPVPSIPSPSTSSNTLTPPGPSASLGQPVSPEALPPSGVRNLNPPPEASSANTAASAPPTPAESQLQSRFNAFMEDVQKSLDNGKLAEAQLALSMVYQNPNLPAEQGKQIASLLDQLAGTVIYSRRHYLEPAYVAQAGDTLDKVAMKYAVPWQLLAKINGLLPPNASNADETSKDQPLPVGMELKVLRGPFDAVVSLEKREITLILQERYAGRFPIGLGRELSRVEGEYTVCNKILNPPYRGPDGIDVRPNDPQNPLGGAWVGLTDRLGIHGTNDPRGIGRDDNSGMICLGDRDLQDLYGILSVGSRVRIVR